MRGHAIYGVCGELHALFWGREVLAAIFVREIDIGRSKIVRSAFRIDSLGANFSAGVAFDIQLSVDEGLKACYRRAISQSNGPLVIAAEGSWHDIC